MVSSGSIRFLLGLMLLFLILQEPSSAATWYGTVGTSGSGWVINRNSVAINMSYNESVAGTIGPVEITTHGRMLNGYHSLYSNIDINDVEMKQRTGALSGRIISEETTKIRSWTDESITRDIFKPDKSLNYTIRFSEQWPVVINSRRLLLYRGDMINDRDFEGNNLDYIGTSYVHNYELSRERVSTSKLLRMNATIMAYGSNVTSNATSTTNNSSTGDDYSDEADIDSSTIESLTQMALQGTSNSDIVQLLDSDDSGTGSDDDSNSANDTNRSSESIFAVQFLPTRQLLYQTVSRSSGIASMRYRQASSNQLSMLKDRVTPIQEGEQVYYGDFNLWYSMNLTTYEDWYTPGVPWLNCICQNDSGYVWNGVAYVRTLNG